MTSTASQPNQNPAPTPSAPAAPSYASAAGANKKPTSTPLIATGSHPPVVVGSSAPAAQNGKPATGTPLNGRPNIPPAIPVAAPPVARGSSVVNGGAADHSRKSSVTISANAPAGHIANGGPVGGRSAIQFGFESSPAVAHSTPQMGGAAPIPIPGSGNPRIPSPANSPSPIPQIPQHSGGQRAPAMGQVPPPTFGSFPGDNDRHMKQHTPVGMGQSPHVRRDSQASTHGEGVGHGGPGHGRGGYQGQGRGRGNFGPQYNNAGMPYPPPRNFSGNNAGRGGVPQYHQGRGGMQQFPGSPQPARASPAATPTIAHGTPNMPPGAVMAPPGPHYYPNMYPQQVKSPVISNEHFAFKSSKKNKGARRDSEKAHPHLRVSGAFQKQTGMELTNRSRRPSKRCDPAVDGHQEFDGGAPPPEYSDAPPAYYNFQPGRPVPMFAPHMMGHIDLSPESGTFEKLLTANKMQMPSSYGMPPDFRMGYPPYPNQQMQQMPYVAQHPQYPPAPHPQFVAPPYPSGQPGAPPMSRNASQVSDRPVSSTGQNQAPVIAQGTPQQQPAQTARPAIVSSSTFARPKKSAAIVIKDSEGNVVDLAAARKTPASPAPGIQQSKTPPAVAPSPTPPPKPSTPSHGRTESAATNKTAEQVRNEFKDAVRKTADGPSDAKAKEEEAAKAAEEKAAAEKAAAEKAAAEKAAAEKAAAEKAAAEKAAAEKAAAEEKAAEERRKEEERLEAEKKAAEEAKAKEKAEAEAVAADAAKQQGEKDKKPSAPDEMDDEELERMIREMEEEDARREKEQAEISARKKAQQEEEKKRLEAEKLNSAENDRKLREQEREMERLEEERERRRKENEAKGVTESMAELLAKKIDDFKLDKKETAEKPSGPADTASAPASKPAAADKSKTKPVPLNLAPLKTTPVEAPQPSAALQSLRSARFLPGVEYNIYPEGISSPNPALNAAVHKKGKIFKYDAQFLLQFQKVFTEQPSVEFHQQVKALIGDSDGSRSASARTPGAGAGRQGSRAGSASAFPGGAMGQFGAKTTLPPGTTSEQRFAMSQGNISRPMGAMPSFSRPGAFPGQLSRTPSSGGAGLPSPRTGSRRGGSRKDFSNKAEAQAAKTMPLTAGQEVKPITISETGWKPISIGNKAAQSATAVLGQGGQLEPEMVQRKVKAALNKMTPENFDRISEQILAISAQSKNEQDGRTLRQVIQLTFEKATDEAHWASMYAKFCKRMLESMSPEIRDESIRDKQGNVVSGGALFRKYLLNRCQEEFERGWKTKDSEEEKAKEGEDQKEKEGENQKPKEAALLSDEYYKAAAAKRRGLGLVQFIGELYKLTMLTERIMHECVRKLLEFQGMPDEAEIESLTKLLRTIGGNLDSTEKGRMMMDAYFQRIDTIIALPELPSRLRFMLMDVVDLRKAGWVSKEANKGPKTLEEVRAEAEAAAAQKAAESARNSQRGGPGGRPGGVRGDSRNFSYSNPTPNQVGIDDLRRLKGSSSRTSSQNPSFGPTSMFNSRSSSGRRMGGPGGAFGRAGEDSGASSRTGTPPTRDRDSVAHTNAFGLLADTGDHPGSPPSTAASPALPKATLDTVAAGDKKE